MELWDLYDRDRRPTGETHIRGEKIPPERYHLVVHVWIRNSQGRWLISQRAADRPTYPLKWECPGGSVTAGEDSLTGAIREAEEEVGVKLDPAQSKLISSTRREDRFQDFREVWRFTYDGPIDLRNATTDEVADMRWMTVEEIRQLYDAGELVHTLGYFFEDKELGGCTTLYWLMLGYDTPTHHENFDIGLFANRDEATAVSRRYRQELPGFTRPEITEIIIAVPLLDSDIIPDHVYRWQGWNVNEALDECSIITSACYTAEASAQAALSAAKLSTPRQEWSLNRHVIGHCDWSEGFTSE